MISRKEFNDVVGLQKQVDNTINELNKLKINILDSPLYNNFYCILDRYFEAHTTSGEALDLLYWWLYEDDKILYEGDKELNLSDPNELYSYMLHKGYWK